MYLYHQARLTPASLHAVLLSTGVLCTVYSYTLMQVLLQVLNFYLEYVPYTVLQSACTSCNDDV